MNALPVLVVLSAYQPADGPPAVLGGDLAMKKIAVQRDRPVDFRESVEQQVSEKRRQMISQLEALLQQTPVKERAPLLFRLADLYSEESHAYPDDREAQQANAKMAVQAYSELVQRYSDFERMDETLYALGRTLTDLDDERRALIAYKRLVEKFPQSRFVANAWLALGDFHFVHRRFDQALEAYRRVDGPLANVAAYKLGWVFFNQTDYERAMEQFRTVALAPRFEKNPIALAREARADFVRAFSRSARPVSEAHELFNVLAPDADALRTMNKQLAALYYDAGRSRDAAVAFKGLIDERPRGPEAVEFQTHVVEVMLQQGDKQRVVQQLQRLAELGPTDEGSDTLFATIAVTWHREVRKTRDPQTQRLTSEVYALYLRLFPSSAKANDLRFFWAELLFELERYDEAGPLYRAVTGRYAQVAGYDAVLAYDALAKAVKAPEASAQPAQLPPNVAALVEVCDAYTGPNAPSRIAYKAARTLYLFNHLREAHERFRRLVAKWPDDCEVVVPSANQSLDALNALEDYEQLQASAEEYLRNACVQRDAESQRSMQKVLEQVKLRRCRDAACFEAVGGKLGLTNAAALYEQEHQLERAIAVRQRAARELPADGKNVWALAKDFEAAGDAARAADAYEAYPSSLEPQAQDALFNAGALRARLGDHARAIELMQRYVKLHPSSTDARRVMLSIADEQDQSGHPGAAAAQLELVAKQFPQEAFEALARIARVYERHGDAEAARKAHAVVVARGASAKGQVELEALGRARLVAAEAELTKYLKLSLRTSMLAKARALKSVERTYTGIVMLRAAEPAICALYKIGVAYDALAEQVEPIDATYAAGVRAKAGEAFSAAVAKSDELQVVNLCSKAARAHSSDGPALKGDLRPFDEGLEVVIDLRR